MKALFLAFSLLPALSLLPGCATDLPSLATKATVPQLQEALAKGASVDERGLWGATALMTASSQNRSEIVSFLIKQGASVNAADGYGDTPLHYALRAGHTNIARILLDAGGNACAKLEYSVVYQRPGVLAAVLASRTSTKTMIDLLMFSAKCGQKPSVEFLLALGFDVNATTPEKHTALTLAAMQSGLDEIGVVSKPHLDTVTLLVDAGADPWVRDADGYSILDLVTMRFGATSFVMGAGSFGTIIPSGKLLRYKLNSVGLALGSGNIQQRLVSMPSAAGPQSLIRAICMKHERDKSGFFVDDKITLKIQRQARTSMQIAENVKLIAFWSDTPIWSAGARGLAICSNGLYTRSVTWGGDKRAYVSWEELRKHPIRLVDVDTIAFGQDRSLKDTFDERAGRLPFLLGQLRSAVPLLLH